MQLPIPPPSPTLQALSTSNPISYSASLLVVIHLTHSSLPSHPTGPEVICTWSGQLPPRRHKNPTYSPRVFLGGVPWDITEAALLQSFQPFGNLIVDWPGKDSKHSRHPPKGRERRKESEGDGGREVGRGNREGGR